MKPIYNRNISQFSSRIRKFLSFTAVSAFVAVPLFGAVASSEAAPPHHQTPSYKAKNKKNNRNRRNNRNVHNQRNNRNNRRNDQWNNRYNRSQEFYGPVTKIKGNRDFDIRANGRIYNVTTSGRLPNNLRRNDQVRVQGIRSGTNDIVNARVTVVRRR